MGRPKLSDSAKRQQTNFRLDPEDKARLERMAKERGESVPALAETLIVQGMDLFGHPAMSRHLLQIFVKIMDEMHVIQSRNMDKPWYLDLTSWAGCKKVFENGPFARANPSDWRAVKQLTDLWADVTSARNGKQRAIDILKDVGIEVKTESKSRPARRGIFGNALLQPIDNRAAEKIAIERIEDDTERNRALVLFELIEAFDAAEATALNQWRKEVLPYIEDESEGEEIYKQWRQEIVKRQLALGERPDWEDIA